MKISISLISVLLLMSVATTKNSALSSAHLLAGSGKGQLCNSFPANKLRFPIKNDGRQMSRPQFKKILEAAEGIYKPLFRTLGLGNFNIVDRWFDDTVNACASVGVPCSQKLSGTNSNPKSTDRYVEMYGGLARHPYLTAEGLMLVICHEIGHHLGGYPRYTAETMSTEGQSDYYATSKCMRLIYGALAPKTNQNWIWTNRDRIPLEVQKPCLASFGNSEAAIYCMRSSLAGLSLAQTFVSLGGKDPGALSYVRKDPATVRVTFESHPVPQCRLDTYVSGALCTVDPRISFSPTNPNQGACATTASARPACWYKSPAALAAR